MTTLMSMEALVALQQEGKGDGDEQALDRDGGDPLLNQLLQRTRKLTIPLGSRRSNGDMT